MEYALPEATIEEKWECVWNGSKSRSSTYINACVLYLFKPIYI